MYDKKSMRYLELIVRSNATMCHLALWVSEGVLQYWTTQYSTRSWKYSSPKQKIQIRHTKRAYIITTPFSVFAHKLSYDIIQFKKRDHGFQFSQEHFHITLSNYVTEIIVRIFYAHIDLIFIIGLYDMIIYRYWEERACSYKLYPSFPKNV